MIDIFAKKAYYTANIFVLKSATQTLCVFLGSTTDAAFTMDFSMLCCTFDLSKTNLLYNLLWFVLGRARTQTRDLCEHTTAGWRQSEMQKVTPQKYNILWSVVVKSRLQHFCFSFVSSCL